MSATNKNHDALIKRIDERIAYWSEGLPSTGPTIELLQDCRAALSQRVRYVPMTDAEWEKVMWTKIDKNHSMMTYEQFIEAAVIRRAIAQGAKLEVEK